MAQTTHGAKEEDIQLKIKLLVLFCVFIVIFTGCGAETQKNGPGPADESNTQDAAEEPASDNNNTISADKNLLTVDVTLPASFFENSTHEQIEAAAKENGIQKVKFNDDGSVTYTMSKAKHKELLDSLKSSVDESITEILNDKEAYPSFVSIKYNNDLTEFTVLCEKDKYKPLDAFAAMIFYIEGNFYQAFNGVDSSSLRTVVKFVDQATGEIIETGDSSKIGADE